MKIISSTSISSLNKSVVATLVAEINALLKAQNRVVLCVPGGRSVVGIFELLKTAAIPWEKIHLFLADERRVPLADKESNFYLVQSTCIGELIKKNLLPKANVHPYIVKQSADAGIGGYNKEFLEYGGACDILLLSSGEDGHVGSLYPNHESVKSNAEEYILVNESPKPPAGRMSLSRKLMENARVAILLFYGEAKQDAYRRFLDKKLTSRECPAKVVEAAKKAYVFTDLAGYRII